MKRLLLGICLACLTIGSSGCCHFWRCCGWGCGGFDDCGGCGGCGDGCCSWGAGCGPMYWGDMCTGNPHCSTCDQCGNWVGPPSPGGNGVPPEVYGHRGPYGQQVARASRQMQSPEMIVRRGPSRPSTSQMVRSSAPPRSAPQMARRSPPPQYSAPQAVRRTNPRQYGGRPAPQTASRGHRQEYEGAVEVLGVTDRVTVPASAYASSRRNEPTLADEPAAEQVSATTPVRSTTRR